jgi:hypothetical protein
MTDQCPPLADLFDEDLDTDAHVAECLRCQALLALAADEGPELGDGEVPDFPRAELPDRTPSAHREIGEIVTVDGDTTSSFLIAVVCAWNEGAANVEVAPVSTETQWATEWDLLLEPADSSLGYPAMVELWNHGPVPADHLAESIGTLRDPAREQFEGLYAAVFVGAPPAEAHTGPPVLSEADPRVSFQREEIERARCYWPQSAAEASEEAAEAVDAVATASTLASRITVWFEQEDCDVEDLVRDTSWSRAEIGVVLENQIDPVVSPFFKHDCVAELLHAIDVEEDELAGLLPASVPAIRFPEPEAMDRAAAFHRGLNDASRLRIAPSVEGTEGEPTPGQHAAQAEWVSAVIAAFEEAVD